MREFDHADAESLAKRWQVLKVDKSKVIDAPPAAVWDTISDHTTWPDWHDDYAEHEALTDQTTGLGAIFRSTEWWKLRSESEITRWEDGRVVGLTTRRATFWRWLIRSLYNEIEVEPAPDDDGKSLVHYRAVASGSVLFWVLSAYTIGQAIAYMHLSASSSLKNLQTSAQLMRSRP